MTITVVPSYRVVSKFARQAKGLPFIEGVDLLESNLRAYVRNLLSAMHPAILDIGERTAVAQLGDPDPVSLLRGIDDIDSGNPKEIADLAIAKCIEQLPQSDMNSRIYILPGDGQSRVLTEQMNGVLGLSLGAPVMLVFVWPAENWQQWLEYTVTHEYAHLVRNFHFPRGIAGGRLVYMNTREPETLLDAMVAEGISDSFAAKLLPNTSPHWTHALNDEQREHTWPRVLRRLNVPDTSEIRRIIYGDNDRIPTWTGYTLGFEIVQSYLRSHPNSSLANLVSMPARTIFEGSEFAISP